MTERTSHHTPAGRARGALSCGENRRNSGNMRSTRLGLAFFGLGLACLASSACSAEVTDADPLAAESGEEAINGGQVERSYPAVGLLRFPSKNFGSGALIAPNVVLTAAHVALGKPDTFFFGKVAAKVSPSAATLRSVPIKEWKVHPCYATPLPDGCPGRLDVAVVHLAEPIKDVAPLPRYEGDLRLFWGLYNPFVGDTCVAVGFGAHLEPDGKPGAWTAGVRRSAKSWIESVEDNEVVVRWISGIATSGDSGSPLLCNGKIVGTVRGSADASNKGVERMREGYIRIDRVADFVDDQVAAWR